MIIKTHSSPNFNTRPKSAKIEHLILHYTGMKSFEAALNQLCNPEKEVSSHYLVDENGDIYELVDPEKRAWHAGISEWRGQKNLNDTSIGIEIVNPGHDLAIALP